MLLKCDRCLGTLALARLSVGAEDWSAARNSDGEAEAWFAEHSVCARGLGLSVSLELENDRFAKLTHLDRLNLMVRRSVEAHEALHTPSASAMGLAERGRQVWAELESLREQRGSCSCTCHQDSESMFCEECCDGGPAR